MKFTNDKLKLILPNKKYKDQILRYKNDMLSAGSSMDGCGDLKRDDIDTWFKKCRDWKKGKNLPTSYVPSTQYICVRVSDNRLVGMLDVRHELSEFLFNYGGNMGDSIAVDERGKGYGKELLRLGLKKAKILGLKKVLLTCKTENNRSRSCILANGGIYEDTRHFDGSIGNKQPVDLERYWITLE